jgi:hypothetical protein
VLWTIDPVLTELWFLLRRETGREASDQLIAGLLDRGLRRESLQPESYTRAWALAREWPDQDFSLTIVRPSPPSNRVVITEPGLMNADFAVFRLGPRRGVPLDLVR